MNEVYRRSCGLDIHKDTVVVCVLPPVGGEGKVSRKIYHTFRNDLIKLRVWLKQLKVTEIAMESTGVYWRPLWNVLEEHGFRLLLVNPAQVKALAGRKSDGRDAQRIAEYLQVLYRQPKFASCACCCATAFRCWNSATRCTTRSAICLRPRV